MELTKIEQELQLIETLLKKFDSSSVIKRVINEKEIRNFKIYFTYLKKFKRFVYGFPQMSRDFNMSELNIKRIVKQFKELYAPRPKLDKNKYFEKVCVHHRIKRRAAATC